MLRSGLKCEVVSTGGEVSPDENNILSMDGDEQCFVRSKSIAGSEFINF